MQNNSTAFTIFAFYLKFTFKSLIFFKFWGFSPEPFSVLVKRLAGKSVSDMTYLVPSETLNLNSINPRTHQKRLPPDLRDILLQGIFPGTWWGTAPAAFHSLLDSKMRIHFHAK